MGFFGKIKENLNHGGVKVALQAPASVSMQDASVPVTVTLTGGDSPQTINRVTVEILAISRNQAFSQPNGNGNMNINNQNQTMTQVVARSDNTEQFTLQPGETKTVQLSIVMNAGAAAQAVLPEGSGMAQAAQLFQKLESVSEAMNQNSYTYRIQAKADVDGVALDPSHSQPLQILKPGEVGGATHGVDWKVGL